MEATPFKPVKLVCGIIASSDEVSFSGEGHLKALYGDIDAASESFPFTKTDYYEKEMGSGLFRKFLSFRPLVSPEVISAVKIRTNRLEREIAEAFDSKSRIINLDPGYCSAAALVMATTKDFAHRVPLSGGIYAHLELLFGRREVKLLPWTYPDFDSEGYRAFFLKVRRLYLEQLREGGSR
jgi:hypothetical protein